MMIVVLRRTVLLVSLMFWQGGFMFYGGVVVPVGGAILGSERKQGFITQSVTNYLNLAGAVCLGMWLEHLWYDRRNGVSKLECGIWGFAAVSLIVLAGLHVRMDYILSIESSNALDPEWFGRYHKLYILTSTAQWLASLALLFLSVLRWYRQGSASGVEAPTGHATKKSPSTANQAPP
jgi:hypothetical protein